MVTDLSEEHFEEVNLNEIIMRVYANDGESGESGGEDALVTEMQLSEQSSTYRPVLSMDAIMVRQ